MFLVFAFDRFYPPSAKRQFRGAYQTWNEARRAALAACLPLGRAPKYEYTQIYDVDGDEWHAWTWSVVGSEGDMAGGAPTREDAEAIAGFIASELNASHVDVEPA